MPRYHSPATNISISFVQFSDWFKNFDPIDALAFFTSSNWALYGSELDVDKRVALFAMARAIGVAHHGSVQSTTPFSQQNLQIGFSGFFGISQVPYLPNDPLKGEKIQVASSFESFPLQDGSAEKAIYRYYLLYSFSSTKRMRTFDFTSVIGMSFESFFTIWISLFGLAHSARGAFSIPFQIGDRKLNRHFRRCGINKHLIESFVNSYASEIAQLANYEEPVDRSGIKMKYDPNPLLTKPIVNTNGETHLIPSPESFINILGNGLYYKAFSTQTSGSILGNEFEIYVANQFHQLKGSSIYRVTTSNTSSRADWILLFQDFTLIVEAKSQRLTSNGRAGGANLVQDSEKFLGKAIKQINETKTAILNPGNEFDFVPNDKPIFGLVVLLEPYYLANSVGLSLIHESPSLPLAVISAYELEEICALGNAKIAGQILGKYITDNVQTPNIFLEWARLNNVPRNENPLIRLAEKALPWSPYRRYKYLFAGWRLQWIMRRGRWYEK